MNETLADVMPALGVPEHLRSGSGPEFVARELRKWLASLATGTLYIELRSPCENGYCESFNGKRRDECLNGEIFYSLKETQVVVEQWRVEYNTRCHHSALGYSKTTFTGRSCNVNSLTPAGTKTRAGRDGPE